MQGDISLCYRLSAYIGFIFFFLLKIKKKIKVIKVSMESVWFDVITELSEAILISGVRDERLATGIPLPHQPIFGELMC